MEWVWPLYSPYVFGELARAGQDLPSDESVEEAFLRLLSQSAVTILVQEPWRGSVRFKCLSVLDADSMFALLADPEKYLSGMYGGGKFKLNFHHGMHFIATRNFKPSGEPLWQNFPDLKPEYVA